MKVIIVDDERAAITILRKMLEICEDIDIVGEFTDPLKALDEIDELAPQVVFLDIEMDGLTGLELAEDFIARDEDIEIVFVTAYSRYAVEAFELNVLDYLLKPIEEDRLEKTLKRLRKRIKSPKGPSGGSLWIRSLDGFQVFYDSSPLKWRTLKTKELFSYLWLRGQAPVSKHMILEDIFMDRGLEAAIALMHTTVYQLRKSLRLLGFEKPITYFRHCYSLKVPHESDLDQLMEILSQPDLREEELAKLIEIYRTDLLQEEGYHWAMISQMEVQNALIDRLMDFVEVSKDQALTKLALNKLYLLDPFNDEVVERTLVHYGQRGNKAQLKHFYEDYSRNFREEMAMEPSSRLIQLYESYISD